MTSPVDLCNLALDQIGAAQQQITSINPPAPRGALAAQVAARTYQTQMDALFRSAHWNSARFQTGAQGSANPPSLTLLKAAWGTPENPSGLLPQPPTGWQYEYALPPDCLKVRFVFPAPLPQNYGSVPIMTNVGATTPPIIQPGWKFTPAIDTDANGNQVKVILTNACQAQAVYTARVPNPDMWDPMLQNAAISTLAAWFVNPLNRNAELLKERIQVAVGLIMQARVSDGDEGVMSMDHLPDWMRVRGAGGWAGFGTDMGVDGQFYAGWDAIGMPDGISY